MRTVQIPFLFRSFICMPSTNETTLNFLLLKFLFSLNSYVISYRWELNCQPTLISRTLLQSEARKILSKLFPRDNSNATMLTDATCTWQPFNFTWQFANCYQLQDIMHNLRLQLFAQWCRYCRPPNGCIFSLD